MPIQPSRERHGCALPAVAVMAVTLARHAVQSVFVTLAQTERAALCAALLAAGPDAPTLCDGWNAHDLAAHLYIRENDPLGAPGIVAKPLQPVTDRRMIETKRKWSFDELVGRLGKGPLSLSVFAIPGVDEAANTVEYFIHHEDLRRAGESPEAPRTFTAAEEQAFWRRLKLMSRVMFRRSPVGITLVAEGLADAEPVKAASGNDVVTITGRPSELMLYAYGRRGVADVDLAGSPEALQAISGIDLST